MSETATETPTTEKAPPATPTNENTNDTSSTIERKEATPQPPAEPSEELKAAEGDKSPETPAADGEKKEEKPEEPRFKVNFDGEDKEFSGPELVAFADEKINQALEIHERYQSAMRAFAETPLLAALDALSAKMGDRKAAYQELLKQCDAACAHEAKRQSMSEEARQAADLQDELEATRSKLKAKEEEDKNAAALEEKARAYEDVARQFKEARQAAGLPPRPEDRKQPDLVGAAVAEEILKRRLRGENPSFLETAQYVKAHPWLYLGEEEYRKELRSQIEKEAGQSGKAKLEEVKKARQAAKDEESVTLGRPGGPSWMLPSSRFFDKK